MPTRDFGAEEMKNLKQVLDSGRLSVLEGGKMLGKFEKAFARAQKGKYAIAMNSGMSVLYSSVIAAGVGPGDEVICDPVCVFGSLAVMYQLGKPVFVDIEPVTFNMDPDKIKAKITKRTKAIIVTHLGGMCARMDRIMPIARKHGLMVIEDCAHAFLSTYKGKSAGNWGDVGSFSLQASKQLSTGDGGMAITNSKKIADELLLHAGAPTFLSKAYGVHYNFRMNEQTAAIGLAQIPKTRKLCRELVKIGREWDNAVKDCPWITAQKAPEGAKSTYHLWIATFEGEKYGISRKRFEGALKKLGPMISLGYTNCPVYRQPVYDKVFPKGTYRKGLCPNAEYMIPRMILGYTMIPLKDAKRYTDGLRRIVKSLS